MSTTLDGIDSVTVQDDRAADTPVITQLDQAILTDLNTKRLRLEEIKAQLKTEFFGIDECIDKVIESIKTWYLLPQIVTRPVVVGLFGLTGCGKTSLVRSLVDKLDFSNRFVEIQMDTTNHGDNYRSSSICSILQCSSIEEGKPGVIFFDEFQRFRTVDTDGKDIKSERYQDIWMLLSDGHFSSDYSFMAKIEHELTMMEYQEDRDMARKSEAEAQLEAEKRQKALKRAETKAKNVQGSGLIASDSSDEEEEETTETVTVVPKYKRRFALFPYEAETLKKMLRLSEPVIEIMTWKSDKIRSIVGEYEKTHKSDAIDYTKCLVFVGGNIDEAFKMSDNVEDCDTSADVFHEYTKKIGVIEIKSALSKRFRPEQIARLGNNHVVYPSLNKGAYMSIIRRSCLQYIEGAYKICGISFTVNESVYVEIYENAVYPAQGTRPVFTSIHKLFGSPLSDAILWGLEVGTKSVSIDLDATTSSLVFASGSAKKSVKIDFDLRARRKDRSDDFNALVAVHEAGHALVYAELFKLAPIEISMNVASFKGGYNLFHEIQSMSKTDILNRMAALMAGIVAEEMVFGPELRSAGCSSDVAKATEQAGWYVRRYAMDGFNSHIEPTNHYLYNHDTDGSDPSIENLVKEQREVANNVLTKHRALLVGLAKELVRVKKMSDHLFVQFVDGSFPGLTVDRPLDVTGDYAKRLDNAT